MFNAFRPALPKVASATRSFSTSKPSLDVAKVILIGRLGSDPVKRETSAGKPYYTYSLATSTGPPKPDDSGRTLPTTNWHTLFAFGEGQHAAISRIGKGSTIYVEAELEMRPSDPGSDGTPIHDRALLRHRTMNVINRVRPAGEEEASSESE